MNFIFFGIFVLFSFLGLIESSPFIRFRNAYLKIRIKNYKKTKKIGSCLHRLYLVKNKFYELNHAYYSMTEEQKEMLDIILSLCF